MYNFIALITLLFSCFFLLNSLKFKGIAENIIFFFCLLAAHIVIIGFMLSTLNQLREIRYWALLGVIVLLINILIISFSTKSRIFFTAPIFKLVSIINKKIKDLKIWYTKELTIFEKLVITPLFLTVILVGIINLIIVVFTAPHNWDSMTYHLARVAYFLQNNNINYFGGNYYAQVVHPRNESLLLIFTYLISGRNENLFQLVQFFSYWVGVLSIYAISRKIGNNTSQSIFSALVGALLTNWLMQAVTTQSDLIITAFLGIIVYSLFAYNKSHDRKYLIFTSCGIGLVIGTKENAFLLMPSIAIIVLYVFLNFKTELKLKVRDFSFFVISSLLSVCIFAILVGYLENYKHFGHPLGPQNVIEAHTFKGESFNYILENGTKNLFRFGFDFLSLDGVFPKDPVIKIQNGIRFIPAKIIQTMGIDIESEEATWIPFQYKKIPQLSEDTSYSGILGFGLVWVILILSLIGLVGSKESRILSLAAIIFFIIQAYVGPYDPWRGRYFIAWAIFSVPIIGPALRVKRKFFRGYLLLIILLGCFSALSSVSFRYQRELFYINAEGKFASDLFAQDRLGQLINSRRRYETISRYEKLVPKNATVAVHLLVDSYEYPLFGEFLTRTLLPINLFDKGMQPIPEEAQYLLYDNTYPCALPDDIDLENRWFLRKLTDKNRECLIES